VIVLIKEPELSNGERDDRLFKATHRIFFNCIGSAVPTGTLWDPRDAPLERVTAFRPIGITRSSRKFNSYLLGTLSCVP
jgi:hypothetical protein